MVLHEKISYDISLRRVSERQLCNLDRQQCESRTKHSEISITEKRRYTAQIKTGQHSLVIN